MFWHAFVYDVIRFCGIFPARFKASTNFMRLSGTSGRNRAVRRAGKNLQAESREHTCKREVFGRVFIPASVVREAKDACFQDKTWHFATFLERLHCMLHFDVDLPALPNSIRARHFSLQDALLFCSTKI